MARLGPERYPENERRCLGCHGPDGPGPLVAPVKHPAGDMDTIRQSAGFDFLPPVRNAGDNETTRRIGCVTCHWPHGPPAMTNANAWKSIDLPPTERRSLKAMLRPYIEPNLCSDCHGADGRPLFLYYHHPAKRGAVTLPR